MKPIYWIILCAIVLLVGGSGDKQERLDAVVKLSEIKKREEALPALRRVAEKSGDPEVLAATLKLLMLFPEKDSLPLYFKALDHQDKKVREAAHSELLKYYGGRLPANLTYTSDAPSADRAKVAQKLQEEFEKPPATPP